MKFRTQFNYVQEEPIQSLLPTMTEPDQSISLQEMLTRYAQGKPVTKSKHMVYTGDQFTPDLRKLDLVDLHELAKNNKEEINRLKTELNATEHRAKARKAKLAAQLEKLDRLNTTSDEADDGALNK